MKLKSSKTLLYLYALVILAGFTLASCTSKKIGGYIVYTKVASDKFNPNDVNIYHNFPGAGLMAFDPDSKSGTELNLTPGFSSACFPQVSYDAKHILFTGRKTENDPWQIWEMNLKEMKSRKLTNFKESCYTPFYLPGDRLVFSREMPDTGTGPSRMLFQMNLDGSNLLQVTYHPNFDYIQTILRDGRILMLSKKIFPEEGEMKSLAMRPNGTKAEIFYYGVNGGIAGVRVYETKTGLIYFTEQIGGQLDKRDLVSIHQNRPLNTRINYTENIDGGFYSLLPWSSNELLVSYCPSEKQTIGLYTFSVDERSVGESLLSDSEYHFLDPVIVEPYKRPRHLPNEVNLSYPTGLIMCQDVNLTAMTGNEEGSFPEAKKIEVLGMDRSLGVVPVEKDGSFFLKVTADLPFRIRTLDENNRVVHGPSDWIWLRPFERRGCVGCHEDHEIVPENIVPLAVNDWPVVIPVDTTGLEEKRKTFELGKMH